MRCKVDLSVTKQGPVAVLVNMRVKFWGLTPWSQTRYAAFQGVMFKFSFDTACASASCVRFYTVLFFFQPSLTLVITVLSTPPSHKKSSD